MEKGLFITLEGVDGSGKSSQARLIRQALEEKGYQTLTTREPGGTKGAEELRALVLNGEADRWSAMSEMLIFTAARRDHVERVIAPALSQNHIVICDRFVDSTRLYQGLEDENVAQAVDIVHKATINLEADLTLVFDIAPQKAFERMAMRGDSEMRFENHGQEFQEKRRAGFLQLCQENPERYILINADQAIEMVTQSCLSAIEALLS